MHKITINVTQEDIDKGQRRSPETCPIALAASRILSSKVQVGIIGMYTKQRAITNIPLLAKQFIIKFDDGEKVGPFSFEIDVYE